MYFFSITQQVKAQAGMQHVINYNARQPMVAWRYSQGSALLRSLALFLKKLKPYSERDVKYKDRR